MIENQLLNIQLKHLQRLFYNCPLPHLLATFLEFYTAEMPLRAFGEARNPFLLYLQQRHKIALKRAAMKLFSRLLDVH